MILRVTFKTPNVLDYAVDGATTYPIRNTVTDPAAWKELKESTSKWILHGEYITVEINTASGTCAVVPMK